MTRGLEHLSDEFEEWLSTDEVSELFGLTPGSVRTNFPRRYGVRPQSDKWLRTDVLEAWLQRSRKAA